MLAAGPTAARAAKAIVSEVRGLPHESTRWHTARRAAAQRVGAEAREGLQAFVEKRPPAWASRTERDAGVRRTPERDGRRSAAAA